MFKVLRSGLTYVADSQDEAALSPVCDAGRELLSEPITLHPCLLSGIQGHTTTTYRLSGSASQELDLLFQDAFQLCNDSERVRTVVLLKPPQPSALYKTR